MFVLAVWQVKAVIARLRKEWMGPDYELLTNNCLHFCDDLAEALQVPKIPGAGARLRDASSTEQIDGCCCCQSVAHPCVCVCVACEKSIKTRSQCLACK